MSYTTEFVVKTAFISRVISFESISDISIKVKNNKFIITKNYICQFFLCKCFKYFLPVLNLHCLRPYLLIISAFYEPSLYRIYIIVTSPEIRQERLAGMGEGDSPESEERFFSIPISIMFYRELQDD